MFIATTAFKKLRQNVFRPHLIAKSAIPNCSGLKSVLGKFRFRDRFVWTIDQSVVFQALKTSLQCFKNALKFYRKMNSSGFHIKYKQSLTRKELFPPNLSSFNLGRRVSSLETRGCRRKSICQLPLVQLTFLSRSSHVVFTTGKYKLTSFAGLLF